MIAAVEGAAYGGGFELALLCDWVFAAESAKFCFPEVARGLFPGLGGGNLLGKVRLPKLSGPV